MAHPEVSQDTLEVDGVVHDNLLLVNAYEQAIGVTSGFKVDNLVNGEVETKGETSHSRLHTSSSKVSWKSGMPVQALYSEDQKYYEAVILKVFDDGCLVKFIGYNNKEKVPLECIKKSLGKEAQQAQIQEAATEGDTTETTEQETGQSSEEETDEMNECDSSRPFFGASHSTPPFSNFMNAQSMIPPPIPPHIMSRFPQSESELLSSMLLSWYMSGYHTGYWQGYHAFKNRSFNTRNKSRKK